MIETFEAIMRTLAARARQEDAPVAGNTDGKRRRSRKKRAPRRDPEKVGEALGRFLQRRGLARQIEYQKVIADWPRLVGPGIARVTQARSVRDGVLVVEVQSSAWAMELNLRKRQIMARLNAKREIRIRRVIFVLSGGEDGAGSRGMTGWTGRRRSRWRGRSR